RDAHPTRPARAGAAARVPPVEEQALIAVVLGSLASASPAAGLGSSQIGLNPMLEGRYEQVEGAMQRALENHPHGVLPLARLGMALARAGRYHEAVSVLERCAGTAYYEAQAVGDHADALRGLGRCDEAADLRLSEGLVAREPLRSELYVG